eukprot:3326246-Pyramimonas_sp.AAC.1
MIRVCKARGLTREDVRRHAARFDFLSRMLEWSGACKVDAVCELSPALAGRILTGQSLVFHCVLIFSHRAPRAQLLRAEPSGREIKRIRRHLLNTSSEVDFSCLHRQGRDMVRARFDEWDPELVINWLGAS